MLIWFVVLYLLVSIGIGLYAATRVHSAKDFAIAGRHLPLPVVTATVFATWFGAEAIFGVSATFVKEGLRGVVADPFGASLCLIIAGIFFSRKLYKLNVLTLGDYFRLRYNRTVEVLTTLCIVILPGLGLGPDQGARPGVQRRHRRRDQPDRRHDPRRRHRPHLHHAGRHALGGHSRFRADGRHHGRHAVHRLADFRPDRRRHAGDRARLGGRQARFLPEPDPWKWIAFIGAWLTMMLGSIPQQDVFQRITSARTAKIALWGSILGGSIYFCFTFVPMFIAYSATLIDPEYNALMASDSQLVLPTWSSNRRRSSPRPSSSAQPCPPS
jgi:Na+/proline symporter